MLHYIRYLRVLKPFLQIHFIKRPVKYSLLKSLEIIFVNPFH